MNYDEKIANIAHQATNLYCVLTVVLESCIYNEYNNQATILEYALKISRKIMAKLQDYSMEWPDYYCELDLD